MSLTCERLHLIGPFREVRYVKREDILKQDDANSFYGLQIMSGKLYVEQWDRLINSADDHGSFAKEHDAELKKKG